MDDEMSDVEATKWLSADERHAFMLQWIRPPKHPFRAAFLSLAKARKVLAEIEYHREDHTCIRCGHERGEDHPHATWCPFFPLATMPRPR
jgi:hypothetical protein